VAAPVRDGETIAQAAIAPYRDQLSAIYTLHLVAYDLEASDATIDVAFDNGFAVRCIALENVVTGCPPVSIRFGQWMQALLADALSEGESAQLAAYADQLSVNPETVAWLAAQGARTSDEYEVTKETQRGSWVIMAVRFDTSDVLNCFFHGAGPVVLDRCRWER